MLNAPPKLLKLTYKSKLLNELLKRIELSQLQSSQLKDIILFFLQFYYNPIKT